MHALGTRVRIKCCAGLGCPTFGATAVVRGNLPLSVALVLFREPVQVIEFEDGRSPPRGLFPPRMLIPIEDEDDGMVDWREVESILPWKQTVKS